MNQKRLLIAASIIALLIAIGFMASVPHTTRDVPPTPTPKAALPTPVVAVKDVYKKGQHTITGSVLAPTACTTVTATASLADASTSPRIILSLAMPADTGMCLQLPTKVSFSSTLVAPPGLSIKATVNGAVASTTAP